MVLVPLMVFVLFSPALYGTLFSVTYDPNDGDQQMLDSLLLVWNESVNEAVEKSKKPEVKIRLMAFDPNIANRTELQGLGVPAFLASRISRYRDKGGSFRVKSDLARIYDFPDSLYKVLMPYIMLPDKLPEKKKSMAVIKASHEKEIEVKKDKVVAKEKPALYIDLNSADTTVLKQLRGIGSGYSRRIVKYRELLGGFSNKQQLNEVYGISDSLYHSLADQVYVQKQELRTVNVNVANFKTLNKHPYISYKQAGSILNTRSKKGKFRSPIDLLVVEGVDSALIQRLKPYITF